MQMQLLKSNFKNKYQQKVADGVKGKNVAKQKLLINECDG